MYGIIPLGRLVKAINPKLAMLLLAARIAFRINRMPRGKIGKWPKKKKKVESYFARNKYP